MSTVDPAELLAAIEHAAAQMADMETRIATLEGVHQHASEENELLRRELAEMIETVRKAEAAAQDARQRADQVEADAAFYRQREERAFHELTAVNNDLAEIGKAVGELPRH